MAVRRLLLSTLVGCAISLSALANVQVNPSAPDRYTVQRGDTLWDISARFLSEPWRWPEIWQGNPQIRNPDLIYPGDELILTYVDGQPVIRLARGGGSAGNRRVVKLSPRVRPGPAREGAVPTIPIDAITHFLSRPMVVEENELESAPYIVSLGTEHLIGGAGTKVYVRGIKRERPVYTVLRQGDAYIDPDDPDGTVLGYAALHIADASLDLAGDPATMTVVRAQREVLVGDRLIPASEEGVDGAFYPRPPVRQVEGSIIDVVEGVTQIGQYQVVVLNRGSSDGLEKGSVLEVWQRGKEVDDPYAVNPRAPLPEPDAEIEFHPDHQRGLDGLTVALDRFARGVVGLLEPEDQSYRRLRLPEERAGRVMVFRIFDRLSYAIVMDATRTMHPADAVRSPTR